MAVTVEVFAASEMAGKGARSETKRPTSIEALSLSLDRMTLAGSGPLVTVIL